MDTFEKLVKLSGQMTPRDRLCRLMQYGSKCCWYFGGVGKQPILSKDYIDRLKKMEASISMGRRMFRLGRSLPMLHAALNTIHLSDTVRRVTLTMARIASAIYLCVDNFIWLVRVGLVRGDARYWLHISSRLWLLSILCNLVRDVYELLLLLESFSCAGGVKWRALTAHLAAEERPLLLDTCSNLADMLLPMSTLAYVQVTPGVEGLMGLLSSAVGLLSVWNPALKMMP